MNRLGTRLSSKSSLSGSFRDLPEIKGNYVYNTYFDSNTFGNEAHENGAKFIATEGPSYWYWLSPFYVDTPETYEVFLGNIFLKNREPYFATKSGDPAQKRALLLYGCDDQFAASTDPSNADDNAYDDTQTNLLHNRPPLTCLAPNTTTVGTTMAGAYTHHGYTQAIQNVPSNAVYADFGAYVRCDQTDILPPAQAPGMYLKQWTGSQPTSATCNVDCIFFSEFSDSDSTLSALEVFYTGTLYGDRARYRFPGLLTDVYSGGDYIPGFNANVTTTMKAYQADSFSDFKLVKKRYTISNSPINGSNRLYLCLYFGEHIAGLRDGTNTPTGSVAFYNPFVQFYDTNGDIILPS